ncbi:MaoC family dehydratase N-terminal domain-containing protein [Mycobacterium sp. 236(2023)]|uniref:FAS1-like dehydratase domain-containing protein n=1 Tax=Mycobacterium sp. 236(2023) TaxID=3038163 RepID=UPI0024156552|nr:MaoC family dehydratase N-terminal domain-containing protein [Mycobacterium sp. 236(2023)]MDG4668044.1 MaoC family dehydratase N-terminal domain-containing protein [Mycobacterium sp. 236(2023)]
MLTPETTEGSESKGPGVTDEARARIGTVTRTSVSEPISLRHIREYLAGTGGDPAEFSEHDEAGNRRPAPVLFFHSACRAVVAESELLDDGQYPFLGVEGVSGETLAGGSTYELLGPVYVGDTLRTTETLLSIDERVGRSGPLAITTTLTSFENQDGLEVARYRQVIIFR